MSPAVAACFEGPFAPWAGVLRPTASCPKAVPACSLVASGDAAARIALYADRFAGADRRAIVSMWTQWYFGVLMVPHLAVLHGTGRRLPVAADEVAILFGETGLPEGVALDGDGDAPGDDPLEPLLLGHVAPFVAGVAQAFGVAPRLVWTNAGTILDWTLGQVPEAGSACPDLHRSGRAWLAGRLDASGRRNPLSDSVRQRDGARCRKICCLRYLLPGVSACGTLCPLPESRTRAQ